MVIQVEHRLEARVAEQAEPEVTAEGTQAMRLMHSLDIAVSFAQGELVVGLDPVIVGVWIPGPLGEAGCAAGEVDASASGAGEIAEGFLHVVRHEQRDSARPAVRGGGPDHLAQLVAADDVVDRVMHEYSVESSVQAHSSHIALDVDAGWI